MLLPIITFAQQHDPNPCGGIAFTTIGAMSMPSGLNSVVGFTIARHHPLNRETAWLGYGVDLLHQDGTGLIVPLSLNLTIAPVTKESSPVIIIQPGYILNSREKIQGVTLYMGAGYIFSNWATLSAGYSQLGNMAGVGVKVAVIL